MLNDRTGWAGLAEGDSPLTLIWGQYWDSDNWKPLSRIISSMSIIISLCHYTNKDNNLAIVNSVVYLKKISASIIILWLTVC